MNMWSGFEAAHIFPLAYQHHWMQRDFDRWVTLPPRTGPECSIHSVQNGLLLLSHLHNRFNDYFFSINPDANHKIICFRHDTLGIAGTFLDRRLLDDPQAPSDELLRWHFRQAVLGNIRVAGAPVFEHDFPPGSDVMGEVIQGPKAAERMEFELFMRLGPGDVGDGEIGTSER
ncbi:hypothetical protein ACRALDRAFT_1074649 [Sodiomyces alcalophilus JCM 7366]|uniref:uncharacterized protein n=1 Tax=Sodiomyces alcalophilus JCM 7366 TaxID=591952 RepID=UPI0039B60D63